MQVADRSQINSRSVDTKNQFTQFNNSKVLKT